MPDAKQAVTMGDVEEEAGAMTENYRPLFDGQGGPARAFECRLCPHELSDKARCFAAGKRRPGRYVVATEHGIRIHLNRVHGVGCEVKI
jgi:hypothetical protein